MAKALMSSHILRKILNAPHVKSISLCSSLFRFLLAGESESQGEVARKHGARAKRGMAGRGSPPATNFFITSVLEPSRDSRLPERKRKRLLRRLEKY